MEEIIEKLVLAIKQEECYQQFILKEKQLQDSQLQLLLKEYQASLEQYELARRYKQDEKQAKEVVKQIKEKVSKHPYIQEYYDAYYLLEEHLQQITNIVFKDISDELKTTKFHL
ncbi:YlbF family regulator [Tannockella kyphosi]|uniref:YlbF family regulator n=1 Tax=Tannockella kyphosi TaxID=2899121 RepID=UPI002011447E|nr:YlbF family regulator [Tannockella kyphosi]